MNTSFTISCIFKTLTGISVSVLMILCPQFSRSQAVVLNADGPGNTYELVNSVLAPGYTAVETPDCAHPAYGRHIAEVMDDQLNKFVFEFYIHVTPDDDRCIAFDRQRVEIKTYDQSPANLIGTLGETIVYKWRFRLQAGFQPSTSFTHIHQIKPVNGDDANPLFTLTARKASTNKLELIHNNVTKVVTADLSLFTGVWVEATETIYVDANGTYSMVIKRVSDNVTLLSYSSSNIMTIRPDNDFIRPKWGMYRSLNVPADLRDDTLRLSDISIEEIGVLPIQLMSFKASLSGATVNINWTTASEYNSKNFIVERSTDGINYTAIGTVHASANSNLQVKYSFIDSNPVKGYNYYRLKMTDINNSFTYSPVSVVEVSTKNYEGLSIYPNPVKDHIFLKIRDDGSAAKAVIINSKGENVFSASGSLTKVSRDIDQNIYKISSGIYFIKLVTSTAEYRSKFLKD